MARFRRERGSRSASRTDAEPRPDQPIASPVDSAHPEKIPLNGELRLEGIVLDESSVVNSPLLPYARMLVSLIEGIEFSCHEIVNLLCQALRQHSIARRRRADYVLAFLNQHPP